MDRKTNHDTLTTGQIARYCSVCAATVVKWCNEGLLVCSRLPNGFRHHRRVLRKDFAVFAEEHGMHYAVDRMEKEYDK